MDVVILNFVFLLVYPMLSEMQLLTVTSPCQTSQNCCQTSGMQCNWEEQTLHVTHVLSFKSVKHNAHINRIVIL